MEFDMELPPGHPAGFFQKLKQHESFKTGDIAVFSRYLLVGVTELFNVNFASIWLLNENKTRLDCYNLYDKKEQKFSKSNSLLMTDYPEYFKQMLRRQKIIVDDVMTDPVAATLLDSYLLPHKITSFADIAIIEGRKIIGVLCLEHNGAKRVWSGEEVVVASCVCTFFANVVLTARKGILDRKYQALKRKNHELNISFQHLLESQKKVQQSLEDNFSFNVNQKVLPLLQKIKHRYQHEHHEIEVLEEYLKSLTSPFYKTGQRLLNISPQERRVIDLTRAGHQAKEVGRLLNISEKTIQTHKKNIRRKLKLQGKKINLNNYLDQLELPER
jgi:DNA-binding CsgD family transcriptional regulator